MSHGIKLPSMELRWIRCPYCGAKTVLATDDANCSGVHIKCTRGCKQVFELVIKDGVHITQKKEDS